MLFNSAGFFLFMLAVWIVHWTVGGRSALRQNLVLLAASAVFYGLVDMGGLVMLLVGALINWAIALRIASLPEGPERSRWFWAGITLDLGLLVWFKYAGFLVEGLADLLSRLGLGTGTLEILLPLGISFYTFQMLGYLMDVHHEEIEPCRDGLHFVTYVLFFPKMLAGPIERAQHFLPQITDPRAPDPELMTDGLRQILWGLFAKAVIADNLAVFVDQVFDHHSTHGQGTLLLGTMGYLVQLYGDFSGYSNIALGVSKMLGIRMIGNFAYPLFGTSVGDFWRRWHISLSSWMMDYVFTPLSFLLRDRGGAGLVISISVTFLAVGLWHGASWNYVVFGVLQSIYFIPVALRQRITQASAPGNVSLLPGWGHSWRMGLLFLLMSLTFSLLRATTLEQTAGILKGMLTSSRVFITEPLPIHIGMLVLGLLVVEWMQRGRDHGLEVARLPAWARRSAYSAVVLAIFFFGRFAQEEYIYIQF